MSKCQFTVMSITFTLITDVLVTYYKPQALIRLLAWFSMHFTNRQMALKFRFFKCEMKTPIYIENT